MLSYKGYVQNIVDIENSMIIRCGTTRSINMVDIMRSYLL